MSEQTPEQPKSIEMGGILLHSGDRIGPYRFEKPIGKGGMADVLLAQDPNGQPMALKVLKSSRFKTGRRRFRREFRALSKLHHENVIQVDSFGDIFGHPFFAMEYVEGTDLHKTIRSFKNFSLSARWERTEEILVDLSRGLAYIHSHGLIHRDLKPSNVLIDRNGLSKITDFGIVKTFASAEQEQVSTTLVGTWAYASPEQISGRPLDHRSDLYSLGIILYAMLTGRRPFAAENMAGYLKLHRDQPPRTPSSFIPEIPDKLERICLRLLQKAPQDRFQSAQEILEELGKHNIEGEDLDAGPNVFPFAGNQETLSQIRRSIQSLIRGEGELLSVIGSEGSGKSRTLDEAQKFAKGIDLPIYRLSVSPKKNPLDATIELAQKIANEEGDILLSAAIQAIKDAKGKHDSDLRHQLFDCMNKALNQLLDERPQIFLIDDIQHAQKPLQELIIYLNATLIDRAGLPLLIIMSSEIEQDWLKGSTTVRLQPLESSDIHKWLIEFCGKEKDLHLLAERLHQETDGAPVFLVEFIQEMINKKQLRSGSPGKLLKPIQTIISDGFDIPPGIRQLARMKVGGLKPNQKPIIEALSVAGRELDIDTLLDILGGDEERTLDAVDQLEMMGLIAQQRIGIDPIIELVQRKIGEVVYEDLLPNRRIDLHKRIAQVLEMNGAAGISANQQIGEHYRLAQQAGKAYQFLSMATVQLWERGLASDALQMLQKATPMMRNAKSELDNKAFLTYRLKLLKVQNEIAQNKGEWQVAAKTLRSMIRYAKEIDHWPTIAEAELGLGSVAIQLKQYEVGERRINTVLSKAEEKNDHKNVIDALHLMCVLAWSQGQLDKCEAIAKIGLSKTRPGDISISRAKILLSMSATMATRGHLDKAASGMEEAADIFSKLVRKESHATILINLSEVHVWQGKWQKAIDHINQAILLSENTLYKRGLAHANVIKAMAFNSLGCIKEAKAFVSDGLRLSKDLSLLDNIVIAKLILAKIALNENKPITADAHLEEAIRASNDSDPERYHWPLQALRAQAYTMQKWKKEALVQLKKVEANIQELPWPRRIETLIYCAQTHEMMGQKSEACKMADYAVQKASALGMNGWVIEAKYILSKNAPDKNAALLEMQNALKSLQNKLSPEFSVRLARRYGQVS